MEIIELGNPILRKHAAKVTEFTTASTTDTLLTNTVDEMAQIMRERDGVGIAAPQLGISLQILIIASRPNIRYPDAPLIEPIVMLNPEIQQQSVQTQKGWEGCLSVPGIRGSVARSVSVDVNFDDMYGVRQQLALEGFPARIFLHEYDHLIGLTFLDRIESVADLISENELAKRS